MGQRGFLVQLGLVEYAISLKVSLLTLFNKIIKLFITVVGNFIKNKFILESYLFSINQCL